MKSKDALFEFHLPDPALTAHVAGVAPAFPQYFSYLQCDLYPKPCVSQAQGFEIGILTGRRLEHPLLVGRLGPPPAAISCFAAGKQPKMSCPEGAVLRLLFPWG